MQWYPVADELENAIDWRMTNKYRRGNARLEMKVKGNKTILDREEKIPQKLRQYGRR